MSSGKAKQLTACAGAAAMAIGMGFLSPASASAAVTPVFEYDFPASWNGTGTAVTDQSGAGDNGTVINGTATTLALDAAIPPGAPTGTQSINTSGGAILDGTTAKLSNATVFADGGFTYHLAFMWDGTDKTGNAHTQKLIDYSGTESLQLVTTSGSASLQAAFADDIGAETVAVSTTILPNTWYDATLTFAANSMVGSDVAGTASLYLGGSLIDSGPATKGTYGDGLARPIGVGQLGANFGYLVGFTGDIYNPSVSLGVVPEPSTLAALGVMGGLSMLRTRRRRKV